MNKLIITHWATLSCGHVVDLTMNEVMSLINQALRSLNLTMTCPKCDPKVAKDRKVLRLDERKRK